MGHLIKFVITYDQVKAVHDIVERYTIDHDWQTNGLNGSWIKSLDQGEKEVNWSS